MLRAMRPARLLFASFLALLVFGAGAANALGLVALIRRRRD